METTHSCPQCQQPFSADAPDGLCPQCLIMAASGPPPSASGVGLPADIIDIGDPAEVAKKLPQFEILELLGRGGMGVVYKARQLQLDRLVALKILPPVDALTADFVARFTREARALAKLTHPNIVNVYDFGETGGLYYIVMEYVDGANLRQLLEARKLTPAEALAIVPKICDALEYAHEEGLVHRDIKPENLLIDKKGRVKIADFGLAKLLRREPLDLTLTLSGMALGTLRYMAPEQMDKPETVDHRADLYSLGVVIYEMLTGETPVGRFELPSQKAQVDVRFDEIVLHALEKEPARRYQHASEVKTDLENVTSKPQVAPVAAGEAAPVATKSNVVVLLDEVDRMARRRQQQALFAGTLFLLIGVWAMVTLRIPPAAIASWIGSVVLFIVAFRTRQQCVVDYLGHSIQVENTLTSGRLMIDGRIVASGAIGPGTEFGGRIPDGAGVGDRIIAKHGKGFISYPCRLFVESKTSTSANEYNGGVAKNEPRLSHLALWGAILVPLFLISFAAFTAFMISYDHPRHSGWAVDLANERKFWFIIVAAVAAVIGVSTPFATTILGGVAIAKIKRSGGKLYGLRLAAADLLAFPLLVLAGLAATGTTVAWGLLGFDKPGTAHAPVPEILVALAVCIFAGRTAWRSIVGRPAVLAEKPEASAAAKPSPRALLSAFLALLFLAGFFFAFAFHAEQGGPGGTNSITIGALDPLFSWVKGPTSSSTSVNIFSWSFFAAVVAGVSFGALWRVGREDQGKVARDPVWWRDWWKQVGVWGGLLLIACIVRTAMNPQAVLNSAAHTSTANPYTFAGLPAPFVKGPDGPALGVPFVKKMDFTPAQVAELNRTFQSYYREFLSLERRHTEVTRDAQGHIHIAISPFPEESLALAQRMTQELRGLVGRDVVPPPQPGMLVNIGLFRHAGEASVAVELWKQGGSYHFKEERIGAPNAAHVNEGVKSGRSTSGDKFEEAIPEEYRVYWKEADAARPAGGAATDPAPPRHPAG